MKVQSKTYPAITRSKKEKIVRVPCNIEETIREEEAFYQYDEYLFPDDGHDIGDKTYWENEVKGRILEEINIAVNQYIIHRYDLGTQLSFQVVYALPITSAEIKTQLESIWSWINSILDYYYTKKAEIIAASDPASVTWDFSTFDATDPQLSLQSLM